jgi:mono/diheme cytochrome c family protein
MKASRLIALLAAIALATLAGGTAVVWSGAYNVSATEQHTAPVYALLTLATRQSIALRARAIEVPALTEAAAYERGLPLYREHCLPCHGAPGVAPAPFALGLTPSPANLALKARNAGPAELYWAIKYGLKMTAMPAWEFRLSDADLWALVAFLMRLPSLAPERYRALADAAGPPAPPLSADRDLRADPARGKVAVQQYACATCHQIPGVVGAIKAVGPPLAGIGSRTVLAGHLPNTTVNMIAWLRSPSSIDPRSAMPDLDVSERDAEDIAAYLATLR